MVILGQTFVALNFAELSSHFPVAGSIYQWSKRLSNRTLGWFTGWIYFWAGVDHGDRGRGHRARSCCRRSGPTRSSSPTRRRSAASTCIVHRPRWSCSSTTLINVGGVRLLAIINNIGVGAEILGMLVFAPDPAVLRQPPVAGGPVRHRRTRAASPTATTSRCSSWASFMALFVVYGFDTAGTFGEETIDAEPPGAARPAVRDLAVGHRRRDLPARGDPVVPGHRAPRSRRARRSASRSRTRSSRTCTFAIGGITLGDLYLFVILIAVFVCTLAIQGASDAPDVLDGPRPAPAAGRPVGPRQPHAADPGQRGDRGRRSSRRSRSSSSAPGRRSTSRSRRPGLIYIALLPVQLRRARSRAAAAGPTRAPGSTSAAGARSSTSSRWSGARLMVINIAIWTDPNLFGVLRRRPAGTRGRTRSSTRSSRSVGTDAGRACRRGRSSRRVVGVVAGRRRACTTWSRSAARPTRSSVEADAATGEAVIG